MSLASTRFFVLHKACSSAASSPGSAESESVRSMATAAGRAVFTRKPVSQCPAQIPHAAHGAERTLVQCQHSRAHAGNYRRMQLEHPVVGVPIDARRHRDPTSRHGDQKCDGKNRDVSGGYASWTLNHRARRAEAPAASAFSICCGSRGSRALSSLAPVSVTSTTSSMRIQSLLRECRCLAPP
jgi:hypothetical protein